MLSRALLKDTSSTPTTNVTFRASTTQGSSALQTNLVMTTPTGTVSGDLLIATITVGNRTITTPSGWTLAKFINDSTAGSYLYVFYRILAAAPASTYTFTASNQTGWDGCMASYSGVTSVGASAIQTNVTSSTNIIAPSVTATGGSKLFCCFSEDGATGTITAPTGMTLRAFANINTSRLNAIADQTVGSGATGTRSAPFSASVSVTSNGFSMIIN